MQYIVKIQSVSDIITNSSSEVFIMSSDAAKSFNENSSISIQYLDTLEDIMDSWVAQDYLENNTEATPEDLFGYAVVDIDDDYDNWESDCDLAHDYCIYSIWNH